MKIRTDNGKYTFVKDGLEIAILRHGEAWHRQADAFNALRSMMCELDAARVVVEAARMMGDSAPAVLKIALRIHDGLVDDREPPSSWAAPLSEAP